MDLIAAPPVLPVTIVSFPAYTKLCTILAPGASKSAVYKTVQREYNFHTSIPMRSAQEGPGRQRIWITLRIHQKNQQQNKG